MAVMRIWDTREISVALKEIGGNPHRNSPEKDGEREIGRDRGKENESMCAQSTQIQRRRDFFRTDRAFRRPKLAFARLFIRGYFKDILHAPSSPTVHHPTPHTRMITQPYISLASDHFDVSVIDAPSLTLREDRINQRSRSSIARKLGDSGAAPMLLGPTINRIRDRQLTYRGEREREYLCP